MSCQHFYFKFGEGNKLFKAVNEGESSDLPFYFNNEKPGWSIGQFLENGSFDPVMFRQAASEHQISVSDISQAATFIETSLPENCGNRFLWIFKHPKLYVFQPKGLVFDGDLTTDKGQQLKTMPAICKKVFKMEEVPEFFAALNANQGYNRRTIRRFEGSAHDIAEHLLFPKAQKLKIEPARKFDFFSPIQFETLVFLIFHHAGAFCSTHRGGTRPDIDLLVEFSDPPKLAGFNAPGKYLLQVKMKSADAPKPGGDALNEYLIWLGQSDFQQRIIGRDWIESQIASHDPVAKWLIRSLDFLAF